MKSVPRCFVVAFAGSVAVGSTINVLTAQTTRNQPLRFEAVSIKRTAPGAEPGRAGLQPGGRYVLTNGPIRILIDAAYPTDSGEILDAPDWVMRDPYDVTAVAGRDVEQEELGEMMRATLAERFKLVAHVEKRERPVFALMRANGDGRPGPSLRPTTDCSTRESIASADAVRPTPGAGPQLAPCRQSFGPGRMESTGFSMEGLAFNLSYAAGRRVIDRTGLKGDYQFTLDYAPAPSGRGIENPGDKPNLFTALREQLGLRLQADVASLSIVVIDSISRPTPD
jgi:uncharacterized protein (TIGR03435 family)